VLLYMIREWFTLDMPVVFFKQPFFPRKFSFAEKIIAEWDLNVHANIPPAGYSITCKEGKTELIQHFPIGQKHLLMPIGRQSISNAPKWLCGTESFLGGPLGTFTWPWDVAFCGHKSSDTDPLQGNVPLACDIHQIAHSCHLAYPLRHFTDDDIWRLHKEWNIPFNRLRYGNMETPDSDTENAFNEDYFPYCNKCFDPHEEGFVICPKTGLQITNISSSLNRIDPKFNYMLAQDKK